MSRAFGPSLLVDGLAASGDRHTQFTVTGVVEGGGYIIVTGVRSIRVRVQVTTP